MTDLNEKELSRDYSAVEEDSAWRQRPEICDMVRLWTAA